MWTSNLHSPWLTSSDTAYSPDSFLVDQRSNSICMQANAHLMAACSKCYLINIWSIKVFTVILTSDWFPKCFGVGIECTLDITRKIILCNQLSPIGASSNRKPVVRRQSTNLITAWHQKGAGCINWQFWVVPIIIIWLIRVSSDPIVADSPTTNGVSKRVVTITILSADKVVSQTLVCYEIVDRMLVRIWFTSSTMW